MSPPTISLCETGNWRQEYDRDIWTQNDFTLTVMGNANVVKREGLESSDPIEEPEGAISPMSQATLFQLNDFGSDVSRYKSWDDSLCELLADVHVRSQRKKDKRFGQNDESDHWLAEFEKLALLELRK